MKLSLIALSFLFAFIASSAQAQFLRDANDRFLVNGATYHILPSINILGGGMTLYKTGNEVCPLTVGPTPYDPVTFVRDNGLPWTISSPAKIVNVEGQWATIFSTGEDLPNCAPSTAVWTIVEEQDGSKTVKVGKHENGLKGGFIVRRIGIRTYKITFCTNDGGFCGDLGLSSNMKLAITDVPMGFVFLRVESTEVSKQLINNVLEA